jgi:hypothetical protein
MVHGVGDSRHEVVVRAQFGGGVMRQHHPIHRDPIMAYIIRAAEHEAICPFLAGATVPIVEIRLAVRFGVEAALILPVLVIFLNTLAVAVNLWLILGRILYRLQIFERRRTSWQTCQSPAGHGYRADF